MPPVNRTHLIPRSVRTILSSSLAAAALMAGAACNDSLVAPTNPALHPADRAHTDAVVATSASCAAIAAAHPGSADGSYAVRNSAGNTFIVYCAGMGSASPLAYLTLPRQGTSLNYASWGQPNSSSPATITTWFSKVQIDVDHLQVLNDDITFSHSNNSHVPGPGVYLDHWYFAYAGGCSGWNDGGANVDLNGTPFSINDMIWVDGWFPTGTINGQYYDWGAGRFVTGKSMNLTGGGSCGDAGIRGNRLQLAFTGPNLASPTVHVSAASGVEGAAVALSASASGSGGVPVWTSWDLGDGTTGTGPIPTSHTYADNGTYTMTFTASDGATTPTTVTAVATIANAAPTATLNSVSSVNEGTSFDISLSNPHDVAADQGSLTFAFDCGDGSGYGAFSTTMSVTCATTDNAVRTVRATVKDKDGGSTEYTATVNVLNVAPTVSAISGATIMVGETYTASGTFTDPGADTFTATVDYGSGPAPLALSGKSFALSHQYSSVGTYTVNVIVTDDDNGVGSSTATVQVLSPTQAGVVLQQMVTSLVPASDAASLNQSLVAFAAAVARGNTTAAAGQIGAFQNKLGALRNSGRINETSYQQLTAYAQRVAATLGT